MKTESYNITALTQLYVYCIYLSKISFLALLVSTLRRTDAFNFLGPDIAFTTIFPMCSVMSFLRLIGLS